jgi:hypothetical protein
MREVVVVDRSVGIYERGVAITCDGAEHPCCEPAPPEPCDCLTTCVACPTTVAVSVTGRVIRRTRTQVTFGPPHNGLQTAIWEINFNVLGQMVPTDPNWCGFGGGSCCWRTLGMGNEPWSYTSTLLSWTGSLANEFPDTTPGLVSFGNHVVCPGSIAGFDPSPSNPLLRCVTAAGGGGYWLLNIPEPLAPNYSGSAPLCAPFFTGGVYSVYNVWSQILGTDPGCPALAPPLVAIAAPRIYLPSLTPCCPHQQDWALAQSCPAVGHAVANPSSPNGTVTYEVLSPGVVTIT